MTRSLFQTQSSDGFTFKVIKPLYPVVFSFSKKLSNGRYDTHPPDEPGKRPDLFPCLSARKIFFVLLPSIF